MGLLRAPQPMRSRARTGAQVPARPGWRELEVMDESMGSGARVSPELFMKEMQHPRDSKEMGLQQPHLPCRVKTTGFDTRAPGSESLHGQGLELDI